MYKIFWACRPENVFPINSSKKVIQHSHVDFSKRKSQQIEALARADSESAKNRHVCKYNKKFVWNQNYKKQKKNLLLVGNLSLHSISSTKS